jgi:hypothetical protein
MELQKVRQAKKEKEKQQCCGQKEQGTTQLNLVGVGWWWSGKVVDHGD